MIKEEIVKNGYKLTKPRLAVLDILEKNCSPRSAREIYLSLEKKIDQASVYRSLSLFGELNLVRSELIKDEKRYFIGTEHHHISCRLCTSVKCVPCEGLDIKVKGFKDIKHEIILTGTCEQCSKKL